MAGTGNHHIFDDVLSQYDLIGTGTEPEPFLADEMYVDLDNTGISGSPSLNQEAYRPSNSNLPLPSLPVPSLPSSLPSQANLQHLSVERGDDDEGEDDGMYQYLEATPCSEGEEEENGFGDSEYVDIASGQHQWRINHTKGEHRLRGTVFRLSPRLLLY
jgi:hypothetical protein